MFDKILFCFIVLEGMKSSRYEDNGAIGIDFGGFPQWAQFEIKILSWFQGIRLSHCFRSPNFLELVTEWQYWLFVLFLYTLVHCPCQSQGCTYTKPRGLTSPLIVPLFPNLIILPRITRTSQYPMLDSITSEYLFVTSTQDCVISKLSFTICVGHSKSIGNHFYNFKINVTQRRMYINK